MTRKTLILICLFCFSLLSCKGGQGGRESIELIEMIEMKTVETTLSEEGGYDPLDPATWEGPPIMEKTKPPSEELPNYSFGDISSLGLLGELDNYLGWRWSYPEGYDRLICWGFGWDKSPVQMDSAMVAACHIARDGVVWDEFIRIRLGEDNCHLSPYYGRGAECSRYLWERGREIGPALAILEFESTFGMAEGTNDFGILWGPGRAGQLEDYCDYLDHFCPDTNDPMIIARSYNPSPYYARNLCELTEAIRGWGNGK